MKEYYFTDEQLKEMQNKSFDEKLQISIAKVLQIINITNGKIYVAYSGGKDSGVILHLVATVWKMTKYANEPLIVGLANTTCEYKGMLKHAREFVKWIEDTVGIKIEYYQTSPNIKLKEIFIEHGYPIASKGIARHVSDVRKQMKQHNILWDDIKDHLDQTIENAEYLRNLGFSDGATGCLCGIKSDNTKASSQMRISKRWLPLIYAPFEVSPHCCDELKKKPQKELAERISASAILGEMACESQNRKTAYKKTGCVFEVGKNKYKGKPIGFWTEQDIYEYTRWKQLPLFNYYGEIIEDEKGCLCTTGMDRTGCKICLFGCQFKNNGIHQLKELEPNVCKVIEKPISEGGLGYGEVVDYLNKYCGCSIDIHVE